jgi:phosphonate transport system permease protein
MGSPALPETVIEPVKADSFFGYWQRLTVGLYLLAFICWLFADTEIIALEPWDELGRMLAGVLAPDFLATEYLPQALWQTLAFALLGIVLGLILGAPLALLYHKPLVATACAFVRAIHEIFWALLFLQIFGLSAMTGILALALPYGATFARVFSDILAQVPPQAEQTLPHGTDSLSRLLYGRVAQVSPQLLSYIRYRFECALRSSAVLGFIGMPTLGFYLESAFRQGHYHQGAALLILFVVLIGTIALWCRRRLLPLFFVLALLWLPELPPIDGQLIWRFISLDILPPMFVHQGVAIGWLQLDMSVLNEFIDWLTRLILAQVLPGIGATLVLALVSLALTQLVALTWLPLLFEPLWGRPLSWLGRFGILLARSVPEYILAFIFMLLLGPSMLPAMLALALHNGSLIAFLVSRQSRQLPLSEQFSRGLDHYCYEVLPRVYPNLMGLLFYRFEVILRETAILGMLGVATLGFYIDSNFSEIRFAGALVLLLFTALLNIGVDRIGRRLLAGQALPRMSC